MFLKLFFSQTDVMCKFIGDPANIKLTDFGQPFFGQLGQQPTPL